MAYFSIIIPLYNKGRHLKSTIKSVLTQTFQDFEIVIINDGSTDNSLAVAESIEDNRIKLFSIKNQGVSYARNFGIEKASSELLVFLDADDVWKTNHLENLKMLYMSFPNCGLYATAYSQKNQKIDIPTIFNKIPSKTPWMGIVDNYFESCSINSIAWTSAVMLPKSTLEHVGNFNENLLVGEDIDLWIRIALKLPVAFINEPTAIYNLHSDNRISTSISNLKHFVNLDTYEDVAKCNKSLKKYLDLNRFSLAIQYKIANKHQKAKLLIDKLNVTNLNAKQRLLLKMNGTALRVALKLKNEFQNSGIHLSSFR